MSISPGPAVHAELEQLAIELAQGAAARVGAQRAGLLDVSAKSSATDLVTDVDRSTERWLVARIADVRPDDAVLGEEGAARAGSTAVRWVLDPIDGTVNFVLGLPQYAVSVAAELDEVIVAGAVSNPVSGETFHARLGGGAYLSGPAGRRRLAGPRAVPLQRAVVGTGFGYDPGRRARQATVVAALLPRIADVRRLGAASLDLCAVATGRLDAYFEAGLNYWDYAAGALVAAEAGCLVTGLRGAAPSSRMVAAAGVAAGPDLFALLAQLGADEVSSPAPSRPESTGLR